MGDEDGWVTAGVPALYPVSVTGEHGTGPDYPEGQGPLAAGEHWGGERVVIRTEV